MTQQETAEQLGRRLSELIAFVEQASQDVQAGKIPNLHNIESEVAVLCKRVETSTPDIARQVQPLMGEMIGKLDQLAQELTEYKQQATAG